MFAVATRVWLKAVPLPCRVAKDLDCVFPVWITKCDLVWVTHTMLRPCRAATMPLCKATTGARRGMCELRSAVYRQPPCGRPAEIRFLPTTAWNFTIGNSDFSGYTRTLRRIRHRRRTARAQHGMCGLARHGTAGARHGMCELAFTLSLDFSVSSKRDASCDT